MDANAVLVLLTAALVAITGFYAWQNRAMVGEMRQSRELSVIPKLSISIHMAGPTYGLARLVNAGAGPALDVNVTIAFHRRDGTGPVERKWTQPLMPPGEIHDFIEPDDLGQVASMEALARICSEITVTGSMRSSIGQRIEVDETTGDLQQWFEITKAVLHVWEEEPSRKMPKELERIRKELEHLNRTLRSRGGG